jgi:uncharacterized membrane protein
MKVNPFDIKTILLARHAQHVALIHFPIALFIAGVLFDCIAQRTKNRTLAAAAYFNLLLAAISTVPAVATGIAAWQWALEGQKLKGILLMHLVLGSTSSVLIWIVFLIHWRARRRAENLRLNFSEVPDLFDLPNAADLPDLSGSFNLPKYRFAIEALGMLVVMLTGHLGGFLSGVNGPG